MESGHLSSLLRLSERVTVAIGVILEETNKASVAMEKQADRVAEQWCLWEDVGLLPVLGGEGFEEK